MLGTRYIIGDKVDWRTNPSPSVFLYYSDGQLPDPDKQFLINLIMWIITLLLHYLQAENMSQYFLVEHISTDGLSHYEAHFSLSELSIKTICSYSVQTCLLSMIERILNNTGNLLAWLVLWFTHGIEWTQKMDWSSNQVKYGMSCKFSTSVCIGLGCFPSINLEIWRKMQGQTK